MSIKDKALEKQLLDSMKRLEVMNDRVGPTPLRHRINEMVVNARIALREFDQDEYEADENWTAPPAWSINPTTVAASFIPNADPEAVAKAEAYCDEPVRAAGFTNLGIKARAFIEDLNDLCHEHKLQIFSFSPMIIQNLDHNEEPIDFPEIQDNT